MLKNGLSDGKQDTEDINTIKSESKQVTLDFFYGLKPTYQAHTQNNPKYGAITSGRMVISYQAETLTVYAKLDLESPITFKEKFYTTSEAREYARLTAISIPGGTKVKHGSLYTYGKKATLWLCQEALYPAQEWKDSYWMHLAKSGTISSLSTFQEQEKLTLIFTKRWKKSKTVYYQTGDTTQGNLTYVALKLWYSRINH